MKGFKGKKWIKRDQKAICVNVDTFWLPISATNVKEEKWYKVEVVGVMMIIKVAK